MAHTRGKIGVKVMGRVLKEAKASASPSSLLPRLRCGDWGWGCWERGGEVDDDVDDANEGGAIGRGRGQRGFFVTGPVVDRISGEEGRCVRCVVCVCVDCVLIVWMGRKERREVPVARVYSVAFFPYFLWTESKNK